MRITLKGASSRSRQRAARTAVLGEERPPPSREPGTPEFIASYNKRSKSRAARAGRQPLRVCDRLLLRRAPTRGSSPKFRAQGMVRAGWTTSATISASFALHSSTRPEKMGPVIRRWRNQSGRQAAHGRLCDASAPARLLSHAIKDEQDRRQPLQKE